MTLESTLALIGVCTLVLGSVLTRFREVTFVSAYEQGLLYGCAVTSLSASLAMRYWG